jgi:hypothetical protein
VEPTPAPVETEEPPAPSVELDAGTVSDAAASDAGSARKTDPSVFACGRQTCASGTQTCCEGNMGAECRPTEKDGPHGKIGFFKAQFEACSTALGARSDSLAGISRCDESVDCGKTDICCEQFLFSGGSVNLCESLPKNGKTPCEYGEVCVEGSPCRLPGTWCRRGSCVKELASLTCDGLKCKSGQSCCGKPFTCKPDAECADREPRITCTRPGDCLSGQHCIVQSGPSAGCGNWVDFVTPGWFETSGVSLACEKDSDCAAAKCAGPPPKKMRCKQSDLDWIKTCACP